MTQIPTESEHSRFAHRVGDLPDGRGVSFEVLPNSAELAALQQALGLEGLRKVRMTGRIAPLGKRDWRLTATFGATVVQPCVATLEPVTTRLDGDVDRQYVATFELPDEAEAEMPEDDSVEPLGAYIDPFAVLSEALSLALPLYPRSEAAEAVEMRITEPGKTAMTDEEAKPFAGLAALRDQLENKGD